MRAGARRSPAERYARIAGALLLLAGLVGLIFGGELVGSGGWQDALHIVAGVLGLAAASSWARDYALGFGLLFGVLGLWGLIAGEGSELLGELPVTTSVIVGNLLLGVIGLGAGAATEPRQRSARPVARRSKKVVRPRSKPRRLASASGLEDE